MFQGSESGNSSNGDEIPMEMDLTAAGPPLSDDESVTVQSGAQAKTIMVYLNLFLIIFIHPKFSFRLASPRLDCQILHNWTLK